MKNTNKKTIYFLILDVFGMGGTVRTVLNVANYLVDEGFDVEIISVLRYRRDPFFYIDPRIRVVVLHNKINKKTEKFGVKNFVINSLNNVSSKLITTEDEGYYHFSILTDMKMLKYIKGIKEGILISTRPSFNIFCSKHANNSVIKVGQEHLNFSIYSKKLQKEISKYYPKLNYLATLTDDDTEDYRRIFKDKDLEIIKLTNSIPPFESEVSSLENKTIIAAGRLVEQKGFDLLIEAFSKIVHEIPDWKVKIFGSGKEKDALQELINKHHLYNNVFLMGPTKCIEKELSKSSIYALSSRFEGFGMVIVEAMQCGVPVVSFDCPKGPAEIIAHNEDGILVEDGNVDEFAEALLELAKNYEKRKKFGKKAIENVKRYSIDEIGKLWSEFLNNISNTK